MPSPLDLIPSRDESVGATHTNGWTGTENLVAIRSNRHTTSSATPVLWCHGFFSDATITLKGNGGIPYFPQLAKIAGHGFPVFAADLGGGSTWASNATIALVDSLITYLGTNYGTRTNQVIIAGESMGSLLALNWAWRNAHRVAAVWLRAPLVALNALALRNYPPGIGPAITGAYGAEGGYGSSVASDTPTLGRLNHDPVNHWADLVGLGPVMRVDYTRDDLVTPPYDVSPFVDAVRPAVVRSWGGGHAENAYVDGDVVGAWLSDVVLGRPIDVRSRRVP